MAQVNDLARALRTLATNASVLKKAILEAAAGQLVYLQSERDHLEDLIEGVREEAAEIKRDFKSDEDLKAENDKLKDAISTCVGIIRASAQVNTKLLADKLEQTIKGE